MKHKNSSDLTWIPWHRYALLLRIDGRQIISLGRFRLGISAYKESLRLREMRGYEARVVDTKKSAFRHFREAFAASGYEE